MVKTDNFEFHIFNSDEWESIMPSWRIHLITGIILTIFLIYLCFYLNLGYLFISKNQIKYFFWLQLIFISLLGSLIPDFDHRKTRIRHGLGSSLGIFILISIIYSCERNFSLSDIPFYLIILVTFIVLLFTLGIIIPFRHHGKVHSISAAILYATTWCIIEYFVFDLSLIPAFIIGIFGFLGYISHLILDCDLKFI